MISAIAAASPVPVPVPIRVRARVGAKILLERITDELTTLTEEQCKRLIGREPKR